MDKEISASELLGSNKEKEDENSKGDENINEDKEKENNQNEPNDNNNNENEEINEEPNQIKEDEINTSNNDTNDDNSNDNNNNDDNDENNENDELIGLENNRKMKKEEISEDELNKIEEKMDEKAELMTKAINGHDEIVKAKEQEEKEIEEYKQKKKQEKQNKEESNPVSINDDVTVKSSQNKRAGNLSKLQKIKNMTKKGKSAEVLLFASNYMIKMYGMNTWINIDNYFDTFFKEFGFFQNINKLKLIYENSEFMFKDGDKVDFDTFLNITSPSDMTLIYALWSVVNNDGEPVSVPVTCEHCGTQHERELTPRNILKSSFNDEHREAFEEYDMTKTINELQSDIVMGERKTVIHEENGIRYKAKIAAPSLKRYFDVDSQMRKYIAEELNEYLPERLQAANDDTDKLRWLYQQKQADVNVIYNRYTEHMLYIESIELTEIEGEENFVLSLEDDGVNDMIEIIGALPDDMMMKILQEIEDMASQENEFGIKGEPFKCSNCKKITGVDNINVGDILFFTIQKMHQKKSLRRRQS